LSNRVWEDGGVMLKMQNEEGRMKKRTAESGGEAPSSNIQTPTSIQGGTITKSGGLRVKK